LQKTKVSASLSKTFTGDIPLAQLRKGDSTVMARHHQKGPRILTGGGDVPGLNPHSWRHSSRLGEGYQVIGIRHWLAGLVRYGPREGYDNSDNFFSSTKTVDRAGRTGGTFPFFPHHPGASPSPAFLRILRTNHCRRKTDLT